MTNMRWFGLALCLGFFPVKVWAQASAACTVNSATYTETFTSSTYKDSNSSVSGWPMGGATLPFKAGGFPNAATTPRLGERVYAVDSGDFTGDGLPDILALSDTGGCHIDVFPNIANNTSATFATKQSVATCTDVLATNAPQITVGDVDNDGKLDFVVASVTLPAQQGTVVSAKYYHNNGLVSGYPTFTATDITSMLTGAGVSWHASGSQMQLNDMNYDGRADLVILSSSGTVNQVIMFPALGVGLGTGFSTPAVTLVANANIATPVANSANAASCNFNCANAVTCYSKGGTAMAIADFNGDTYPDIVVGSVSENKMSVFVQAQDGTFGLNSTIINLWAPLLAQAADMDGDGTQDLVVWQSGNDCGGPPSNVSIFFNGGLANFSAFSRRLPIGGTASFGLVMNVDGDSANTQDLIAGKTTGVGIFSYYANIPSTSTYNVNGLALSNNVTALDANRYAVVSVVVTSYATTPSPATGITMYVSNDGGLDWEPFTSAELSGTEHTFTHFGADLRWKAVYAVPAVALSGAQAIYTPGATSVPKISTFAMQYNYVGQRTYTRSGLASGKFNYQGTTQEMLYSAAFTYPGYEAQLYAYNISSLTPGSTASGSLARVDSDSSVSLAWEAGSLLAARAGSARTLYTAYPTAITADPDAITETLLGFTTAEATGGSSNPNLATMMTIAPLTSSQRSTLMNWLVSGMGDVNSWKVFDPGHSTPVFVGPPAADGNYLGNNYSSYVSQKAGRTPIVLLGGNDGFLHAFNAATGAEMWGFVPYNLLSKLKTQRAADANGNFYYTHQNFVDGRITVQDIYRGGQWYTIAVVGEGQGSGLAGDNYYFALDITDTSTPKALWEFSDLWSTPAPACSLNQNTYSSCGLSVCGNSTVSRLECQAYDSSMSISSSNPTIPLAGSPYGCIEAEHFDNLVSSAASQDWNTLSATSARNGQFMAAPNALCTGGSQALVAGCAQMIFHVNVAAGTSQVVWPYVLMNPASTTGNRDISWGVDGVWQKTTAITGSLLSNSWSWQPGSSFAASVTIPPGDHYFNIWVKDANTRIDTLVLQNLQLSAVGYTTYQAGVVGTTVPAETCSLIYEQTCTNSCSTTTLAANGSTPWPSCGNGANMTCCGSVGGDQYCAAVGTCGSTPATIMGQTYSPPAIGQVNTTAGAKWAVFFASGYNNRAQAPNVGRNVYAIDAYTGGMMATWNFADIAYSSSTNPSTIANAIPGGVSLADVDNDGYVDRAYVGDLEGRVWKINTAKQTTVSGTGLIPTTDWPSCLFFDAGNPNQTGTRVWAPIITTPAIASLAANTANVYFGTGGDDRAPDTNLYKFYSIRDSDLLLQCQTLNRNEGSLSITNLEWVIGDGFTNGSPKVALATASDEGTVGDRYWADPVISNGTTIYFASLPGKIESVNPCISLQGTSKVYGYAVQDYRDSTGASRSAGTSTLGVPWIATLGKVRSAALIRNGLVGGTAHGAANPVTQAKSDVFLQNFAGGNAGDKPAIQRLSEGGTQVASKLRMLRWREVPL